MELTGRNSVTPSTRPNTMALGTLSSLGVSDDEDDAWARATTAVAAWAEPTQPASTATPSASARTIWRCRGAPASVRPGGTTGAGRSAGIGRR